MYTSFKVTKLLYESLVISTYTYCLENLINIKQPQINKLNVLLNKCTHKILGFSSYKLSTYKILKQLNWLSVSQLITFQSLKLIHKISYENEPKALTRYLHHNMERSSMARFTRKPSVKTQYISTKTKDSFFHRSVFIYNKLPDEIRLVPKK